MIVDMTKLKQDGILGVTGLFLIVCVMLLIAALAFGGWAFSSRQDYKNNVDQKIAAAVTVAQAQESNLKDKQFAEAQKLPYVTYNGPDAYGAFVLQYPRTWSGYVAANGSGTSNNNAAFAAYFNPGLVPSVSDKGSVYALQVQVLNQGYSDVLNSLNGSNGNSGSAITSAAYALPNVPKAVGVKTSGTTPDGQTGTAVILPLRTQTLELWTDGNQYIGDFNTILSKFTFSP